MLISEAYRDLNRRLHETRDDYGVSSQKWIGNVHKLAEWARARSILDYGCGKGSLRAALGDIVQEYDPAVPGKDARPEPADLVVCTDVLEHVEPECLDAVLDDLKRVTLRVALLTVATVPARKELADGRNAHLIVQPPRWWIPKFFDRFDLVQFENAGTEFAAIVRPLAASVPQ